MRGFILASATLISFSQQSMFLLLVLISTNLEKDCSQRYVVTNGVSISNDFLAIKGYGTIWWHQNGESVVVLKSYCWSWLFWSSIISSRYSSLTSAVATLTWMAVSPTMDMTLWWGSIHQYTLRVHLSVWQLLTSAPQV